MTKPTTSNASSDAVQADQETTPTTPKQVESEETQTTQEQIQQLIESLQRLQAEFDNYRKRTQRDITTQAEYRVNTLLTKLLPLLDDIDQAKQHKDIEGLLHITQTFSSVISDMGVQRIPTNESFNPKYHEALLTQPTQDPTQDGHIVKVLRNGYTRGDVVLQYAQVIVARHTTDTQTKNNDTHADQTTDKQQNTTKNTTKEMMNHE